MGGNVGDEGAIAARFQLAVLRLRTTGARISSLYRSAALGEIADQPFFLNAVLELPIAPGAALHSLPLFQQLMAVEQELGRNRAAEVPGGSRSIDLDLIAYGELRCQTRDLTLPHPRATERAFVLAPLVELAGPSYCLPGETRSVLDLLREPQVVVQPIDRLELKLGVPPV
jgi:2-amino-4-hydroxy-6-hydroxymethyldihydropteridine diphosphokinase